MQSHKKTTDYLKVEDVTDINPNRFYNKNRKVTKKPFTKIMSDLYLPQQYKNIWYLKTLDDDEKALREVIAQEIFRLLIPNQPKTRLIEDALGRKKYIASKEVPGYRALDSVRYVAVNNSIKSGVYHGLGEVLIASLIVNESDLRPVNLCLNDKNQIIKIDGDRCFLRMFPAQDYMSINQRQHEITEHDLAKLPFVDDYTPWNWLDYIESGECQPAPKMIDEEMSDLPTIRAEINRAILKALVLPEDLITTVMKDVTSNRWRSRPFCLEIINRCEQLKEAAFSNKDFCDYLLSKKSMHDLKDYLKYLSEFKTTGKRDLGIKSYEQKICDKRLSLIAEIKRLTGVQNNRAKYEGMFFADQSYDPMDIKDVNVERANYKHFMG